MKNLPHIQLIENNTQRDHFSWKYYQACGLPVPVKYIEAHQAFQIEWKGEVIGGFIIGEGPVFRTVNSYAKGLVRPIFRRILHPTEDYSEICCYWLDERFQKLGFLNIIICFKIGMVIQKYANKKILFGTDSRRVAQLFSFSTYTRLIHKDQVYGAQTFMFTMERRHCMNAFWQAALFQWRWFFRLGFPVKAMQFNG